MKKSRETTLYNYKRESIHAAGPASRLSFHWMKWFVFIDFVHLCGSVVFSGTIQELLCSSIVAQSAALV